MPANSKNDAIGFLQQWAPPWLFERSELVNSKVTEAWAIGYNVLSMENKILDRVVRLGSTKYKVLRS